jgi:hypothetical protein
MLANFASSDVYLPVFFAVYHGGTSPSETSRPSCGCRPTTIQPGCGKGQDPKVELVLANGNEFPHTGRIGAIEALVNNETGTIPFRADFPDPDGLLRHG